MEHYNNALLHPPIQKVHSTDDLLDVSHSQVPNSLPSSSQPQLTQAQAASMRRKKNADAQAAFRARRANYITSLEETVTSLEAVVLSLQDTCREARNDADDLRRETNRLNATLESLKQEARDRDKLWRDSWQAKMQSLGFDDPHMMDMPVDIRFQQQTSVAQVQGGSGSQGYQLKEESRYTLPPPPFGTATWMSAGGPFSSTRTRSSASESPPNLSPTVQYTSQSHTQHQSLDLSAYHASGELINDYADANSVSASLSLERYEEERSRPRRAYSGPILGRTHDSGIYGRGADMSLDNSPQAMRARRHASMSLGGGQHPNNAHASNSQSPSVSPPPGSQRDAMRDPPISNTLAVIKAQAFGSLRRARTRSKKISDTASQVAIDMLSARGIGMGVQTPSRLQRKRGKEEVDNVEM